MKWLFITLVAFHVATVFIAGTKKQHDDYLECTSQTEFHPGVCDCTTTRWRKCFIKLTITKNTFDTIIDDSQLFSVNGGRIGPTIIAKYNQLIVADVYNEINGTEDPANANLSMHWHGMHQFNTAWMDGVGMITQWPTKPHNAFRYVFRAYPGGTHWYHSHQLFQRDEGILGALIVRDRNTKPNRILLRNVVDNPGKAMLAIRDKVELRLAEKESELAEKSAICEPDGSVFPLFPIYRNRVTLEPLSINGVKLGKKLPTSIPATGLKPIFYVKRGESFRFRILGIMVADVLRISIDKHKLHVMSADGYLTKPFITDILVVHIAERYDFILKANEDYEAGTVFPIRIETIAVKCNDYSTPEMVGYAYLQYTDNDVPEEPQLVDHYGDKHRCEIEKCTALNCPFESYPPEANITCHNVAELRLLNPTPRNQLPQHTDNVVERFFNFAFRGGPVINGIKNELPQNVPFVNAENEAVVNECLYGMETCDEPCAQALYLRQSNANKADRQFTPQTIRFVLSSIAESFDGSAPNVATHPIHLHGHSFFVTKIAYPPYNENSAIIGMNPNLTQPEEDPTCGPARWTNDELPSDIVVDSRTVRKDVIIVPAGGYVVIEILADNPGWWFLHCHIDAHSNGGMAIAISELPNCQTAPENDRFKVTQPYWFSRLRYIHHQLFDNVCRIKGKKRTNTKVIFADEPVKQASKPEKKWNENNLRQKTLDQKVANNDFLHWRASPYHKRTLDMSTGDTGR